MKFLDLIEKPKKLVEQVEEFSSEDLKREILNLKEDISNGVKVCRLYFTQFKNLNINSILTVKNNLLLIVKNLEKIQKEYHSKYKHYDDIYEKYGDEDDYQNDWYQFDKLKDTLYDIQNDIDDIRDLIVEMIESVDRHVIIKLNIRYNTQHGKENKNN